MLQPWCLSHFRGQALLQATVSVWRENAGMGDEPKPEEHLAAQERDELSGAKEGKVERL
jgi:hypothetical protein